MTTSNPLLFPGFHMHVVEGSIKAVPGYGITELSVVVSILALKTFTWVLCF